MLPWLRGLNSMLSGLRPHLETQAATDSATWTSLGGRQVVSAANAAYRAEEQRAAESDDEQDDDVVCCAALLSIVLMSSSASACNAHEASAGGAGCSRTQGCSMM